MGMLRMRRGLGFPRIAEDSIAVDFYSTRHASHLCRSVIPQSYMMYFVHDTVLIRQHRYHSSSLSSSSHSHRPEAVRSIHGTQHGTKRAHGPSHSIPSSDRGVHRRTAVLQRAIPFISYNQTTTVSTVGDKSNFFTETDAESESKEGKGKQVAGKISNGTPDQTKYAGNIHYKEGHCRSAAAPPRRRPPSSHFTDISSFMTQDEIALMTEVIIAPFFQKLRAYVPVTIASGGVCAADSPQPANSCPASLFSVSHVPFPEQTAEALKLALADMFASEINTFLMGLWERRSRYLWESNSTNDIIVKDSTQQQRVQQEQKHVSQNSSHETRFRKFSSVRVASVSSIEASSFTSKSEREEGARAIRNFGSIATELLSCAVWAPRSVLKAARIGVVGEEQEQKAETATQPSCTLRPFIFDLAIAKREHFLNHERDVRPLIGGGGRGAGWECSRRSLKLLPQSFFSPRVIVSNVPSARPLPIRMERANAAVSLEGGEKSRLHGGFSPQEMSTASKQRASAMPMKRTTAMINPSRKSNDLLSKISAKFTMDAPNPTSEALKFRPVASSTRIDLHKNTEQTHLQQGTVRAARNSYDSSSCSITDILEKHLSEFFDRLGGAKKESNIHSLPHDCEFINALQTTDPALVSDPLFVYKKHIPLVISGSGAGGAPISDAFLMTTDLRNGMLFALYLARKSVRANFVRRYLDSTVPLKGINSPVNTDEVWCAFMDRTYEAFEKFLFDLQAKSHGSGSSNHQRSFGSSKQQAASAARSVDRFVRLVSELTRACEVQFSRFDVSNPFNLSSGLRGVLFSDFRPAVPPSTHNTASRSSVLFGTMDVPSPHSPQTSAARFALASVAIEATKLFNTKRRTTKATAWQPQIANGTCIADHTSNLPSSEWGLGEEVSTFAPDRFSCDYDSSFSETSGDGWDRGRPSSPSAPPPPSPPRSFSISYAATSKDVLDDALCVLARDYITPQDRSVWMVIDGLLAEESSVRGVEGGGGGGGGAAVVPRNERSGASLPSSASASASASASHILGQYDDWSSPSRLFNSARSHLFEGETTSLNQTSTSTGGGMLSPSVCSAGRILGSTVRDCYSTQAHCDSFLREESHYLVPEGSKVKNNNSNNNVYVSPFYADRDVSTTSSLLQSISSSFFSHRRQEEGEEAKELEDADLLTVWCEEASTAVLTSSLNAVLLPATDVRIAAADCRWASPSPPSRQPHISAGRAESPSLALSDASDDCRPLDSENSTAAKKYKNNKNTNETEPTGFQQVDRTFPFSPFAEKCHSGSLLAAGGGSQGSAFSLLRALIEEEKAFTVSLSAQEERNNADIIADVQAKRELIADDKNNNNRIMNNKLSPRNLSTFRLSDLMRNTNTVMSASPEGLMSYLSVALQAQAGLFKHPKVLKRFFELDVDEDTNVRRKKAVPSAIVVRSKTRGHPSKPNKEASRPPTKGEDRSTTFEELPNSALSELSTLSAILRFDYDYSRLSGDALTNESMIVHANGTPYVPAQCFALFGAMHTAHISLFGGTGRAPHKLDGTFFFGATRLEMSRRQASSRSRSAREYSRRPCLVPSSPSDSSSPSPHTKSLDGAAHPHSREKQRVSSLLEQLTQPSAPTTSKTSLRTGPIPAFASLPPPVDYGYSQLWLTVEEAFGHYGAVLRSEHEEPVYCPAHIPSSSILMPLDNAACSSSSTTPHNTLTVAYFHSSQFLLPHQQCETSSLESPAQTRQLLLEPSPPIRKELSEETFVVDSLSRSLAGTTCVEERGEAAGVSFSTTGTAVIKAEPFPAMPSGITPNGFPSLRDIVERELLLCFAHAAAATLSKTKSTVQSTVSNSSCAGDHSTKLLTPSTDQCSSSKDSAALNLPSSCIDYDNSFFPFVDFMEVKKGGLLADLRSVSRQRRIRSPYFFSFSYLNNAGVIRANSLGGGGSFFSSSSSQGTSVSACLTLLPCEKGGLITVGALSGGFSADKENSRRLVDGILSMASANTQTRCSTSSTSSSAESSKPSNTFALYENVTKDLALHCQQHASLTTWLSGYKAATRRWNLSLFNRRRSIHHHADPLVSSVLKRLLSASPVTTPSLESRAEKNSSDPARQRIASGNSLDSFPNDDNLPDSDRNKSKKKKTSSPWLSWLRPRRGVPSFSVSYALYQSTSGCGSPQSNIYSFYFVRGSSSVNGLVLVNPRYYGPQSYSVRSSYSRHARASFPLRRSSSSAGTPSNSFAQLLSPATRSSSRSSALRSIPTQLSPVSKEAVSVNLVGETLVSCDQLDLERIASALFPAQAGETRQHLQQPNNCEANTNACGTALSRYSRASLELRFCQLIALSVEFLWPQRKYATLEARGAIYSHYFGGLHEDNPRRSCDPPEGKGRGHIHTAKEMNLSRTLVAEKITSTLPASIAVTSGDDFEAEALAALNSLSLLVNENDFTCPHTDTTDGEDLRIPSNSSLSSSASQSSTEYLFAPLFEESEDDWRYTFLDASATTAHREGSRDDHDVHSTTRSSRGLLLDDDRISLSNTPPLAAIAQLEKLATETARAQRFASSHAQNNFVENVRNGRLFVPAHYLALANIPIAQEHQGRGVAIRAGALFSLLDAAMAVNTCKDDSSQQPCSTTLKAATNPPEPLAFGAVEFACALSSNSRSVLSSIAAARAMSYVTFFAYRQCATPSLVVRWAMYSALLPTWVHYNRPKRSDHVRISVKSKRIEERKDAKETCRAYHFPHATTSPAAATANGSLSSSSAALALPSIAAVSASSTESVFSSLFPEEEESNNRKSFYSFKPTFRCELSGARSSHANAVLGAIAVRRGYLSLDDNSEISTLRTDFDSLEYDASTTDPTTRVSMPTKRLKRLPLWISLASINKLSDYLYSCEDPEGPSSYFAKSTARARAVAAQRFLALAANRQRHGGEQCESVDLSSADHFMMSFATQQYVQEVESGNLVPPLYPQQLVVDDIFHPLFALRDLSEAEWAAATQSAASVQSCTVGHLIFKSGEGTDYSSAATTTTTTTTTTTCGADEMAYTTTPSPDHPLCVNLHSIPSPLPELSVIEKILEKGTEKGNNGRSDYDDQEEAEEEEEVDGYNDQKRLDGDVRSQRRVSYADQRNTCFFHISDFAQPSEIIELLRNGLARRILKDV